MKNGMKTFVSVSVLIAAFGLGLQYACAESAGDSGAPLNPFLKPGYAKLGLSDAQMSAIRAIVKKNLPELQSVTNQAMAEWRTLKRMMHAESVHEAEIRSQAAKLAALQADLSVTYARIHQEVRSTVLTPDQVKKAEALRTYLEKKFDRYLAGVFMWYAE